jgi:hypothetical protein
MQVRRHRPAGFFVGGEPRGVVRTVFSWQLALPTDPEFFKTGSTPAGPLSTGMVKQTTSPDEVVKWLGLAPHAPGLVAWERSRPGDIILLVSWCDLAAAKTFEGEVSLLDGARLRRVRVVRDYSMFDPRQAPQFYPGAKGAETKQA